MYCDFPDFGRCCICLPLRRGVLLFCYLNIIVAILQLTHYSYSLHHDVQVPLVFHGAVASSLLELSIVLTIIEIIANCFLLYGAHLKRLPFIKVFYYYAITSTVASVLIFFSTLLTEEHYFHFEMTTLLFAGVCIQIYLIALVRSLIRQLEISGNGTNGYENRLQQIVAGDVYEPTVVSNEPA